SDDLPPGGCPGDAGTAATTRPQTGGMMGRSTTQKAVLDEAKRLQMRYVSVGVPRTVRAGRVLVHNHVRPVGFGPLYPVGGDGFRAWTQIPEPDHLERCDCGWAPECPVHYRVRRDAFTR